MNASPSRTSRSGHRLDRIGRGDRFAKRWREVEDRDDILALVASPFHNRRILFSAGLSESVERLLGFENADT
jgi:hypothetical protein